MSKQRVALLGLGVMGTGMAGRLLSAGFPLAIYNRNREKAQAFASSSATIEATPREAAHGADVIIGMVADDHASRSIWMGEDGALAGAAPGAVLIESSTLSIAWVRELAAAAAAKGCDLLDAPVTGSKPQAAAGELLFLTGGAEVAVEKARPVLAAMGRDVVHLGPTGSGATLKLVNNFMCGVQAASFAEGLALLKAEGLDPEKVVPILLGGAPGSPLTKVLWQRVTEKTLDTPNFVLTLMTKDIRYAAEEGERHGVRVQTAAAAQKIFENAINEGLGEKDFAAVLESVKPAK